MGLFLLYRLILVLGWRISWLVNRMLYLFFRCSVFWLFLLRKVVIFVLKL